MKLLYPDLMFRRITGVSPELLRQWGITTLVLDVDNTLTTHGNPEPDASVLGWLEKMKATGMSMVILSNNSAERVRPFAQVLGLDFTAGAMKPLRKGFRETATRLGVLPYQMAVIGDQIFTDILGGNLFGARTILVEPMEAETGWGFRLKRRLEKGVLRSYAEKMKGGMG